jgi:hypothetical protein
MKNGARGRKSRWRGLFGLALAASTGCFIGIDPPPPPLPPYVPGALIAAFGGTGVVTSTPSTGPDEITGLVLDNTGTFIAAVGFDESPGAGDSQWRIEKRSTSSGALDTGFGTGGVITNNPGAGADAPTAVVTDTIYLYIGVSFRGACVAAEIPPVGRPAGLSPRRLRPARAPARAL